MSTTAYYEHLKETMPEGLGKNVFELLMFHIGQENRISLDEISMTLDADERQVRDAIETLRSELHVPVCSQSGKAGRWLAKDRAELDEWSAP